ncbi:hypothetical protein [Enterobacter hormaechei]|uniref:hypothetical protein n=1 Tax=Enterobacter hormaechei TaxID=158836 RepID=UPI001C6DD999|nr:hypothetical protein [Enterobacter hormaechei]MBW9193703.1 hypothetical protein [Enterobacter hormaechei]MDN7095160.1 hypothetical protein [Enterobacter hormaechei]
MGELIDFAERQKSRRKKKASSIPPIFRKFRVHAIRLLARALLQIVGGDKLIIPFC